MTYVVILSLEGRRAQAVRAIEPRYLSFIAMRLWDVALAILLSTEDNATNLAPTVLLAESGLAVGISPMIDDLFPSGCFKATAGRAAPKGDILFGREIRGCIHTIGPEEITAITAIKWRKLRERVITTRRWDKGKRIFSEAVRPKCGGGTRIIRHFGCPNRQRGLISIFDSNDIFKIRNKIKPVHACILKVVSYTLKRLENKG
jgi:hypothetical protein